MSNVSIGKEKDDLKPGEYDAKIVIKFDDGQIFEIFRSAIENIAAKSTEHGIASCDGIIITDNDYLHAKFEPGISFELYWCRPDQEPRLEHRYLLDYVESESEKGKECKIKFEARSLNSPLIDYGMHKELTGTLGDLLTNICNSRNIPSTVELDDDTLRTQVDAWVDVYSCYGALRLLGASFDFLVQDTRDGTMRLVSTTRFVEEISGKTPVTINSEQLLSFRKKTGRARRD